MRAFQSHNGAIAAIEALKEAKKKWKFQSHNGAIAANGDASGNDPLLSFNPTMVRLLPSDAFWLL